MDVGEFLYQRVWNFAAMGGMLLASAFFSGSETALFTLSRSRLNRMSSSRGRLGRGAADLMRRHHRLLNTLLLGNMLANIAFSATAAVMVLQLEQAGARAPVVGVASFIPLLTVLLLGEVTPKMLALSVAETWARLAAGPILLLEWLFRPVLWLLERVLVGPITKILAPSQARTGDITAEELAGLMDLSARRGIIDPDANAMLQEIVELKDIKAGDVMVPRVDFIAFDIDRSAEELVRLFTETHLRKLPVYRKDIDNILGVVHAKRLLLNPTGDLQKMIRPVAFLPETASLEKILARFRATKTQMAIVVDEYGGTAGLITLKDVLEEIVGDIPDVREKPAEPVRRISSVEYVLDGDLAVRDWAEAFDIDLTHKRITTLGGLVTSRLGRLPKVGDTLTIRNMRLTVESMRGRRIEALRLRIEGVQQ
jgi:putative hemolysin